VTIAASNRARRAVCERWSGRGRGLHWDPDGVRHRRPPLVGRRSGWGLAGLPRPWPRRCRRNRRAAAAGRRQRLLRWRRVFGPRCRLRWLRGPPRGRVFGPGALWPGSHGGGHTGLVRCGRRHRVQRSAASHSPRRVPGGKRRGAHRGRGTIGTGWRPQRPRSRCGRRRRGDLFRAERGPRPIHTVVPRERYRFLRFATEGRNVFGIPGGDDGRLAALDPA
jgi:hypothetical protein